MPEVVFAGAENPILGGGRVLASPSTFYVSGEDRLRIVSANSLAGVAIVMHWRFATNKGYVVANRVDHTPNSDRTTATQDYELGVGTLLNITIAATGEVQVGQTYVMVQLVRGLGSAAIILGTLLAGYVTSRQPLGFPGTPIARSTDGQGYVHSITGATPAVTSEIQEACPNYARYRLLGVQLLLTTSAAGGSRFLKFKYGKMGGINNAHLFSYTIRAQGASEACYYLCTAVGQVNSNSDASAFHTTLPISSYAVMGAGDLFQTLTIAMQAGDQYAAPLYQVEEWLDVR